MTTTGSKNKTRARSRKYISKAKNKKIGPLKNVAQPFHGSKSFHAYMTDKGYLNHPISITLVKKIILYLKLNKLWDDVDIKYRLKLDSVESNLALDIIKHLQGTQDIKPEHVVPLCLIFNLEAKENNGEYLLSEIIYDEVLNKGWRLDKRDKFWFRALPMIDYITGPKYNHWFQVCPIITNDLKCRIEISYIGRIVFIVNFPFDFGKTSLKLLLKDSTEYNLMYDKLLANLKKHLINVQDKIALSLNDSFVKSGFKLSDNDIKAIHKICNLETPGVRK